MPWSLRRFHQSGQTHFVTFSCYKREPLLNAGEAKILFEDSLERVRKHYRFRVYGYVLMPEHVHLLLSEPEQKNLAVALKALKQGIARRLRTDSGHFWHHRYYDFNIRNNAQFVEKLRYIHRNPVKRGLCANPEDWEWSSFRHYATGLPGKVEIESEWTARLRERGSLNMLKVNNPTQAKEA